jgi:diacylglycerol kinase (ATP)
VKYNAAIALELPKFEPLDYEITLDGQLINTKAMLIAIGNGSSYGGGMLVCPNADLHDNQFDVMILEPVSRLEFLKVFPKVFSGRHIHHPQVSLRKARKVSITAPAVAYADGERIGALPISAESIPGALLTWLP